MLVLQKLLVTRKSHKVVHCIWSKHRRHCAASNQQDWLILASVFMFLVGGGRHLDFFNVSLKSSHAAVMWNVKFINVKVSVHALAAQRLCYAVGSSVADVHLLKNVRYGSYDNTTRRPQELWLVSTAKCPIDAQCRLLQAEKTAELAKPSQLTVVTTLHHSTWNNINTATAQSSLTFIHKTFQLSLVSQSEWQNKLSN